jgi:hypothetical protein
LLFVSAGSDPPDLSAFATRTILQLLLLSTTLLLCWPALLTVMW